MKVFFGGSLPGYRQNKDDYLEIRRIILLNSHKLTRDWIKEESKRKISRSQSEMYELTEDAINVSDAVILEYSNEISAVGQQLVLSLQKQIPTLLLVKDCKDSENSPLSDYFIGSKHFKILKKERYKQSNLKDIISKFLEWVKNNKTLVRFNLEIERELDNYLKIKALKNKTSKSEEIRNLIMQDLNKTSYPNSL